MGIKSKISNSIYNSTKTKIVNEIEANGFKIIKITVHSATETKLFDQTPLSITPFNSILANYITPNYWQVYQIENNYGYSQLYIQPFSDGTALPGEHHMILTKSVDGCTFLNNEHIWVSSNSQNQDIYNKSNFLPSAKNLSPTWKMKQGYVEFEWLIQIQSLGENKSKIVVNAGKLGSSTNYTVGFSTMKDIIEELHNDLSTKLYEYHIPLNTSEYDSIANTLLEFKQNNDQNKTDHTKLNSQSYSQVLREALAPYKSKRVLVDDIPQKKMKNIVNLVLPSKHKNDQIIASIDLTMFGSSKYALVFTETDCFYRYINEISSFKLKNIRSINKELSQKEVVVLNTSKGKITISSYTHVDAVTAVFEAIIKKRG